MMPPTPLARWLLTPRPNPAARLRLYCLPHAGGGASAYARWPARLPTDVEVCPVQPPGREHRLAEPPAARLTDLAAAVADAIRTHADRPFALFGHSLGAVVALEVARTLRTAGGPAPAALLVSGHRPPQTPDPGPPLHPLPDAEFVGVLQRRYQAIPEAVLAHPELRAIFIPILRADIRLAETHPYRDEPPLACPLVAFGGRDDVGHGDDLGGWRVHTTGPFRSHLFPGGHFFLHQPESPFLRTLADELTAIIGPAGSQTESPAR